MPILHRLQLRIRVIVMKSIIHLLRRFDEGVIHLLVHIFARSVQTTAFFEDSIQVSTFLATIVRDFSVAKNIGDFTYDDQDLVISQF